MIKGIVAIDDNLGIARGTIVPWHKLSGDMRWFYHNTVGGSIFMGRKAFESIGSPLPKRINYVATRQQRTPMDGVTYISDALSFLRDYKDDLWVIGGADIFSQTLDMIDELYVTRVAGEYGCDIFFPAFTEKFRRISKSPVRTENGITYHFEIWKRDS